MKCVNNQSGFTLIEMIIVIVIIGLGMSLATYAFSLVNVNNVKSYASQYQSDLRYIKNQTMATQDDAYYIQWDYNDTDEFYFYELYKTFTDGSTEALMKTVKIHPNITLFVDKTGTFTELKDLSEPEVRIEFNKANGKLEPYLSYDGGGDYQFINEGSGVEAVVQIIQSTGRVFLDD